MTDNNGTPETPATPAASDEYVQAIINNLQAKLTQTTVESVTLAAKLEMANKLINELTEKVDELHAQVENTESDGVDGKPTPPPPVAIREGDKAPRT